MSYLNKPLEELDVLDNFLMNAIATDLKATLRYLQNSTADNAVDDSTRELHDYVCKVKTAPEVKEDYMRFEELIAHERAEAATEAARAAMVHAVLELLEDYGEIPDALRQRLQQSNDEALRKYLKLAAKADSIEAFMEML